MIAPLMPSSRKRRGGQWRDYRTIINGILWKLRTGATWRDVPERYGPWQRLADRLYRWRRDGTWDRILAHAQSKSDAVGEVIWEVSVDSSTVRAPYHASGARRRPSQADGKRGPALGGRRPRAQPGWTDDQVPSRLRRQGAAARARGPTGSSRTGLQLSPLLSIVAPTPDPAHHSRALRSASTSRGSARPPSGLRPSDLRPAQRGGTLHQPTQTVARTGDPPREARPELSGDGGHRLHRHLPSVVIC